MIDHIIDLLIIIGLFVLMYGMWKHSIILIGIGMGIVMIACLIYVIFEEKE